jgi:hypothetical protein
MIGVASGSVCVPLNPIFTAVELQRYLADLRVSALLMRADADSASWGVAHSLPAGHDPGLVPRAGRP